MPKNESKPTEHGPGRSGLVKSVFFFAAQAEMPFADAGRDVAAPLQHRRHGQAFRLDQQRRIAVQDAFFQEVRQQ